MTFRVSQPALLITKATGELALLTYWLPKSCATGLGETMAVLMTFVVSDPRLPAASVRQTRIVLVPGASAVALIVVVTVAGAVL